MFKQKQEEWLTIQKEHEIDLQNHKEHIYKASIFFTTTFYMLLPEDLKMYIYPFVSFQEKTFNFFTRYMEMFKVVGNFMYTPQLNKKNAKFFIKDNTES